MPPIESNSKERVEFHKTGVFVWVNARLHLRACRTKLILTWREPVRSISKCFDRSGDFRAKSSQVSSNRLRSAGVGLALMGLPPGESRTMVYLRVGAYHQQH
ncbi:hypothetical protein J6590_017713 [Homalodisca vitripennis]|nr:hypothetical protein J6590_017713 [Homalodisca vitripennis]